MFEIHHQMSVCELNIFFFLFKNLISLQKQNRVKTRPIIDSKNVDVWLIIVRSIIYEKILYWNDF